MSPYYHSHVHYSRSYAVGYQCGICGRYARAQQRVPQCGVCLTPLCQTCNQSGFCAKHFAVLSPEDQALAQGTSLKMKRSMYIFVIAMISGFACFMIAMPISITSSIDYGVSYILAGIFIPMGVFMALIIGGAVYYQVTVKRGWQTMQDIGRKYRTGQEFPAGPTPFPAFGTQGAYFPPQPTYPSQATFAPTPTPAPPAPEPAVPTTKTATRYCPFCGYALVSNAQFCGNCGSVVK